MKAVTPDVPNSLRVFFFVHFVFDVILAIPLFFIPIRFLALVGWPGADPVMTRLVAAALFAIGIESLFGSRASEESFLSLLNLKVVWSVFALCGIIISIAETAWNPPLFLWIVLGLFTAFSVLWLFWRISLR